MKKSLLSFVSVISIVIGSLYLTSCAVTQAPPTAQLDCDKEGNKQACEIANVVIKTCNRKQGKELDACIKELLLEAEASCNKTQNPRYCEHEILNTQISIAIAACFLKESTKEQRQQCIGERKNEIYNTPWGLACLLPNSERCLTTKKAYETCREKMGEERKKCFQEHLPEQYR